MVGTEGNALFQKPIDVTPVPQGTYKLVKDPKILSNKRNRHNSFTSHRLGRPEKGPFYLVDGQICTVFLDVTPLILPC